jgi:hypothetical protein
MRYLVQEVDDLQPDSVDHRLDFDDHHQDVALLRQEVV